MKTKLAFLLATGMIATPALAGSAAPTPEAGAGLVALALIGAGYGWMRKRSQ
ncbi:MAG: hypothetical protein H6918_02590 [Sphingomonadaceae bacterium]|nr:hypothetical protein [Sphingomonadaceae bacterium]